MLLLTCNNFETHLTQSLNLLRQNDEFTDVTLTCDVRSDYEYGGVGFKRFKQFKAHKIILVRYLKPLSILFHSLPSNHNLISHFTFKVYMITDVHLLGRLILLNLCINLCYGTIEFETLWVTDESQMTTNEILWCKFKLSMLIYRHTEYVSKVTF